MFTVLFENPFLATVTILTAIDAVVIAGGVIRWAVEKVLWTEEEE